MRACTGALAGVVQRLEADLLAVGVLLAHVVGYIAIAEHRAHLWFGALLPLVPRGDAAQEELPPHHRTLNAIAAQEPKVCMATNLLAKADCRAHDAEPREALRASLRVHTQ